MALLKQATALVLLLVVALFSSSVANAQSNSNTCLANLGALNTNCPASTLIPSLGCCIAVSNFNKAGCFCNPVMSTLAGAANVDKIKNQLMPVCAVLGANPLWWIQMAINKVRWTSVSCTPFSGKTYNGGSCPLSDMGMDNARLGAALGVGQTIQAITAPGQCFNYQGFIAQLQVFMDPNPSVIVGYGIGKYSSIQAAAEYLALASPQVNKKFWFFEAAPQATDPNANLLFVPGGAKIVLGASGGGSFFNSCTRPPLGYLEQVIEFEGCSTLIKNYIVPGESVITGASTHLRNLIPKFVQAGADTKTWGIEDICNYHEVYCTGANKQFISFAECKRFMTALPVTSDACTTRGLVMSGNSTTCRFKHHLMAPFSPENHCFHMGYGNLPDAHGIFKCNDAVECVDSNPSRSNPAALNLTPSAADAQCTLNDRNSYTSWTAPTGITCPAPGRRLRRQDK